MRQTTWDSSDGRTSRARVLFAVAGCLIAACSTAPPSPNPNPDAAADASSDAAFIDDAAIPDLAPPPPCGPAPTLVDSVSVNPNNPVGALLNMTVTDAASVVVQWGDVVNYMLKNSVTVMVTSTSMPTAITVPLVGLRTGVSTVLQVTVNGCGGKYVMDNGLSIKLPDLAASVPAFKESGSNALTMGFVALALGAAGGPNNRAAVVDRAGLLQWYREAPAAADRGFVIDQAAGRITVFDASALTFGDYDLAGALGTTWKDTAAPLGADGHGFVMIDGSRAMLLGRDSHVEDSRAIVDGGVADARVLGVTVDEVDTQGADGGFSWNSYPEITLAEASGLANSASLDPLRASALSLDDNDPVVSLAGTGTVVRIDRAASKIKWRLGGSKSDFKFVGDARGGLVHPFDAHYIANGNLLVVDGGRLSDSRAGRVVEYQLDETAQPKTATLIWSMDDPNALSEGGGSADRVDTNNTLIAWTSAGLVSEVDMTSKSLWSVAVTLPGPIPVPVIRARLLDSLYP